MGSTNIARPASAVRQVAVRSMLVVAAVATTTLAFTQISSAHAEPRARATATTIQVRGKEFSYTLSAKSIPRPGTVTFNFKNAGTMAHDFRINGKQTPLTRPGKTAKLVVTFKRKGNYHYLCTVPGHAAAGMKGVFTVR